MGEQNSCHREASPAQLPFWSLSKPSKKEKQRGREALGQVGPSHSRTCSRPNGGLPLPCSSRGRGGEHLWVQRAADSPLSSLLSFPLFPALQTTWCMAVRGVGFSACFFSIDCSIPCSLSLELVTSTFCLF